MSHAELTFTVTNADTAEAVGSGALAVLGTPVLVAWCEAVTCACLDLANTETSVGTRIDFEHLVASAVGSRISVQADVAHRDGRLVRFAVTAYDENGRLVGSGTITRVIVDIERFLARIRER